jgi:hypothetical protein
MKIISGILVLLTVYLNFKHGWAGLNNSMSEAETTMMTNLGIHKMMVTLISTFSLVTCLLVLFPQTFFWGNILNAIIILVIMGFALQTGNFKIALIEIPFLLMPLLLIYLGHPFKK